MIKFKTMRIFLKIISILIFFIFVLLLINILHATFFKVDVVFYSSIEDIPIAVLLTLAILSFLNFYKTFSITNTILLSLLMVSIGYSFAISIPTVVDRSLSIYLLEKIQQRGGSVKVSSLEHMIITEYIKEQRLADIRLTEQLESGTIKISGDCLSLTSKGEYIATLTRFYRKNFLPKHRLILNNYSDELTDPFRNSPLKVDYGCVNDR